jgi:hypothetical protein
LAETPELQPAGCDQSETPPACARHAVECNTDRRGLKWCQQAASPCAHLTEAVAEEASKTPDGGETWSGELASLSTPFEDTRRGSVAGGRRASDWFGPFGNCAAGGGGGSLAEEEEEDFLVGRYASP